MRRSWPQKRPDEHDGEIDLTSNCKAARHSGATVPESHEVPSGVMIVSWQMPKSKNDVVIH